MERIKIVGIVVVVFGLFAFYLSLANWLWFAGIVSLPLGSAVPDPMPFIMVSLTITILYIAYRQRRVVGAK